MIDELLTKIIDFIFLHHKNFIKNEEISWNNHWQKMIQYYQKNKEIFEINDKWDYYCNEMLHNHYKSIVKNFSNLSCLECGCGGGYESALMAKEGANITILDYSPIAIKYAKIVAERLNTSQRTNFICDNILSFYPQKQYDIVWNYGTIEHYGKNDALNILRKMKSLTKNGGFIIITIPNLLSPQSIYWMLKFGKGSEKYFSHKKLLILMKNAGLINCEIKYLDYWLPSLFPYKLAIVASQTWFFNKMNFLKWLFTGIGIKSN